MKPQFALRLGKLHFSGWKVNFYDNYKYNPDFRQKSVDMKIGLDMAWISSKNTVGGIILVAGDSDFIKSMKRVRKEGILVYLCLMGHKKSTHELKEHADFIID